MKNKVFELLGLCVIYLCLGIFFSYPLINNLATRIPNDYLYQSVPNVWGDFLQLFSAANEHLNRVETLLKGRMPEQKEFCFEEKCYLTKSEILTRVILSSYWLITIVSLITSNPILAYNINILMSFITTGVASYYLSSAFVKSSKTLPANVYKFIAFASSLFITIYPKRLIHLFGGQKNGYLIFLVILIMYFFEKLLKNYKKNLLNNNLKYYFGITLSLIFLAANEQFFVFYTIIYLGLRILWFEFIEQEIKKNLKINLQKVLRHSWLAIIFLFSYLLNYIDKLQSISVSVAKDGREFDFLQITSPDLTNLLSYPEFGFDRNIYIGVFGLAIIFICLFIGIYKSQKENRKSILIFLSLISLFFIILALGANTSFFKIFYDYLPFYKYSRTPGRAIFMVLILLATVNYHIFVYGIEFLYKKFKLNIKLVYAFLGLTIILMTYNVYLSRQISVVAPPTVNAVEVKGKVLFLPLGSGADPYGSLYEYYLSEFDSNSINGYDPFPTEKYESMIIEYSYKLNSGDLSDEEFKLFLQNYDIDYIVLLKKETGWPILPVDSLNLIQKPEFEKLENFLDSRDYLEMRDTLDNYGSKVFEVR